MILYLASIQKGCERVNFKAIYFNLWSQVWQLHKEFANMKGSDEEWTSLVDKSGEIMKQHENTPQAEFVKGLILVVIDEIERCDRAKRKENL